MPVFKVSVKWGKEKYDNVELDTSQPVEVFKALLFSLTNVPIERQKVAVKGKMLKDETDLSSIPGLKDGILVTMMGTAGELPKEPVKPVVFLEDMSTAQVAQALRLPAGLQNLGNTCYMNATLQCLRAMPELQSSLHTITDSMGPDPRQNIPISLKQLFKDLQNSGDPVMPMVFLALLQSAFPQFGERDPKGGFMQQDAEECWGSLVASLKDKVPGLTMDGAPDKTKSWVEQFMTIEALGTMQCDENPEEPPSTVMEHWNKLSVNISAGITTYLAAEIQNLLTEKLEKNSPTLNRTANYTKKLKFSRLPQYLTVGFVRFQWKATERIRAKILKKVKFPFELDMTTFCDEELQKKFQPAKQRLLELDEQRKESQKRIKLDPSLAGAENGSKDAKPKTPKKELYESLKIDPSLANDVGANVSGVYELLAVLTHAGRSADSGHYIAWKKEPGQDQWYKFDDDKVTPVSKEEIEKLDGGGDWHSAYICLYGMKDLE